MRIIILLILFVISQYEKSSAQGLNVELGFNNAISQSAFPVCNYNGSTYFVRYEVSPGFSSSKQILSKHDTLGNLIWETELEFDSMNLSNIDWNFNGRDRTFQLLTDSSGLYLFAYRLLGCDAAFEETVFIDKFSHNGQKLWTYFVNIPFDGLSSAEFENANGLSLDDNGNLYLLFNYDDIAKIVTLNAFDGVQSDSLLVELNSASSVLKTNDLGFLVSEENQIKKIDSSGVTMQILTFNQMVNDLIFVNGQYYALIGDSILLLNESLNELFYFQDPNYSGLQKLKNIEGQIWLTSQYGDNTMVLRFDPISGLELIKTVPKSMQLHSIYLDSFAGVFDFDKHHITFVELFQLTERKSLRYLDFSLQDVEQFQRIDSDVGVVGIEVTNADISYTASRINILLDGKVCIKNFGTNPISSVRINKFHYLNFDCSFDAFSQEFSNINIPVGDTAWFYCTELYRSFSFYSPSMEGNPINLNLCVYSSHPNNLVDLNVANDEGCESFVLGFHSVGSISSNNSNRKLFKVVDVLGRETSKQPGQLLLYIYDNGEVEKVFQTW
jgi:hypothetical protein